MVGVVVVATIGAGMAIAPAAAQPALPAAYFGDITVDGEEPTSGTVQAVVDGNVVDSIAIDPSGEYTFGTDGPDGPDSFLIVPEDVGDGNEVEFRVQAGFEDGSSSKVAGTVTWESDDVRELDLSLPNAALDTGTQIESVEGGSATGSFEQGDIQQVEISGLPGNVDQVQLESSTSNPVNTAPPSDSNVQQYVDITPQKSSGEDVEVNEEVDVKPTVSDSAINNLDDPTLIHFVDGSWTRLETEVVGNTLSATASGLSPFAVGEAESTTDPDDGDPDDGSSTGPGPGPGPGPGTDEEGDDEAPSVEEIESTLDLVVPTTETSTEITDADPETPGVTVDTTETEQVNSVTFENEEVTGSVEITEYIDPPEQVKTEITEAIVAAGAVDTSDVTGDGGDDGSGGTATVNIISVTDISPDNEAAQDSAATVSLSVSRDEVNDPERLTVVKETYDFEQQERTWTELETTLEEVNEEQVTVSARAESFSLFAVAEVTPTDEEQGSQQVEDDDQESQDPQEPDQDSSPIVVLVILVILAAAGAALYVYNQQEMADPDEGGGGDGNE